jgi:orotidine 5'-phosphate decarboxylase subfamily 2
MQSFFDWVTERATTANSLLCVGLDPRATTVHELYADCVRIIDATQDYAAAFKPNSAFFEAFGPDGMHALQEVIAHVPHGIPIILDAKRGDIGDTSEAYAKAAFDVYRAHAITVSPYLGSDSVAPFIARAERGAFVLCKTSNQGADELQTLRLWESLRVLHDVVAEQAQRWNTLNNVGLVVGATDPAAMARVRTAAPELWFLVPGIGAQDGDLEASLKAGLRSDGLGLLINASRSIARASDPAVEARKLRDEINQYRTVSCKL